MALSTRYIALAALALVVSVSAVALGFHHRPFSARPTASHMAPRQPRSIVIDQHPAVEKTPTAPIAL